jgi:hypothetical protein
MMNAQSEHGINDTRYWWRSITHFDIEPSKTPPPTGSE